MSSYRIESVEVVFFDEPDRPIHTEVVVGAVWSEEWEEEETGIDDSQIFFYCEDEAEFESLCDKSAPRGEFYFIREEDNGCSHSHITIHNEQGETTCVHCGRLNV